MLVKYDKMYHKKDDKFAYKQVSDAISPTFDPHKVLDKINNYKKPQTPNFKLMTSRPDTGDSLPTYMKVRLIINF